MLLEAEGNTGRRDLNTTCRYDLTHLCVSVMFQYDAQVHHLHVHS